MRLPRRRKNMGQKNAVTKRFCGDKIRFADLMNGLYFGGRAVIRPEDLTGAGEFYAETYVGDAEEKKHKYLERSRDIMMHHVNGSTLRLLAIEDQHYIDYSMPFRNMQYDALEYQHQLEDIKSRNEALEKYETRHELLCKVKKKDRILPVYTVCVYLGEEKWDGPRSLRDMMDFGEDKDGMSKCFADYPFRLYCVNEEQDFSMFQTDIRTVFELLPLRKNKKRLLEKLENNKEYTHMTEDSLEFLSVVMDSPGIWKNRKKYLNKSTGENNQKEVEEYDMCQAIRELIEDGRLEGRQEAHLETLKQNVENLMKSLSVSLEKACELLGRSDEYDILRQMMD